MGRDEINGGERRSSDKLSCVEGTVASYSVREKMTI